jgi:hypothetical protein
LLILDDAFSAIDRKTKKWMAERLFGPDGILNRHGIAVIQTTQDGTSPLKDRLWPVRTIEGARPLNSFTELLMRSCQKLYQVDEHCRLSLLHSLSERVTNEKHFDQVDVLEVPSVPSDHVKEKRLPSTKAQGSSAGLSDRPTRHIFDLLDFCT